MLMPVLLVLIIAASVFCAVKVPALRKWLAIMSVPLFTGAALFGIFAYMSSRTDCGAAYDPDLGCAASFPGWLILLGLLCGLTVVLIGFIIIALYVRQRSAKTK